MNQVENDILRRELDDALDRESKLKVENRELKGILAAYERCMKIIEVLIEDDPRR